jgi:UDP-glucose 4-epimerase
MSKKILVTGGAGFIGSHLVDYLINEGHRVVVLDDLSGGLIKNINPKANFINGSINDYKLVDSIVKQSDIIFHLAAYAAEGLSHFVRHFNYENNLMGSINLINSAIRHEVEHFVFTSSMAVYGKGKPPFEESDVPCPEAPYGISKLAIEMDLKSANDLFGLNYTIIRPHNIYGERQYLGDPYRNVIGIFMNRIMQEKPLKIYGDGKQKRAFSYVGDIIPCLAKAPFIEKANKKIINLGSGKVYSLNELAKAVKKSMGTTIESIHTPPRKEVKFAFSTTKKSEDILSFKDKVSLQEGLSRMAKWAKSVGPMKPVLWEKYEVTKNLPDFWRSLLKDYSEHKKRKSNYS